MPYHNQVVPDEWREPIGEWLGVQRAAGLSPETIKTKRCEIGHVAKGVNASPAKVTGRQLVAYFGTQSWSNNSRKGYRATCRTFFAWYQSIGGRPDNPALMLPKVRPVEPAPKPCPDKWILAAYQNADDETRLMLQLGAEAGLRRAEIARCHSGDVVDDLLGYSLRVVGKGDKQRYVPIGDDLAAKVMACNGWCFPGRMGGHTSDETVGLKLSALLPDGYTAHSLRHRYATRTYEQTHDIYVVSKLLGHASVETTRAYVAMPERRLREAVAGVGLAV